MNHENPTTSDKSDITSPSFILFEGDNGLYMSRDHGIKDKPTLLGKGNGAETEKEVFQLFLDSNISPSSIYSPYLGRIPNSTKIGEAEVEISDGLVEYGDTMFLLQIKSRNIKPISKTAEFKKVQEIKTKAYKQAVDSLEQIKLAGGLPFTAQDGTVKHIRAEDYNWVALIILNWNVLPLDLEGNKLVVTNSADSLPRVVITLDELESVQKVSPSTASFLNYLRRLQYQPQHRIGEEWLRYVGSFVDTGSITFGKSNLVTQIDFAVEQTRKNNAPNAFIQQRLLYPMDFMSPDELGKLQTTFSTHLDNHSHEKLMAWVDNDKKTIYTIFFIDSSKIDLNDPAILKPDVKATKLAMLQFRKAIEELGCKELEASFVLIFDSTKVNVPALATGLVAFP